MTSDASDASQRVRCEVEVGSSLADLQQLAAKLLETIAFLVILANHGNV